MGQVKIAYFEWNDGHPRWNPGPLLRKAGYKSQLLKDAGGAYLPLDAAMAAAAKLNEKLNTERNTAGGGTAHSAPQRIARVPIPRLPSPRLAASNRSVAALIDRYKKHGAFAKKAKKTQRSYAYHLRLIDELFGDLPAMNVNLEILEDFYKDLEREKGRATANAVTRTGKLLFNYGAKHDWLTTNPWSKLETGALAGRLVVWAPQEIKALMAAAKNLGWQSQADALLLGLLTGQRQGDIRTLVESAFDLKDKIIQIVQMKTKAKVRIPMVPKLYERLKELVGKDRIGEVTPLSARPVLLCETTGEPWKEDYFRHTFAKVRAEAAKLCPSVLDKRWSDLRDTAITWLAIAQCTIPEIASITGHSLATIHQILDKHYLVRDDQLSVSAVSKLADFVAKTGIG